jgi:hypothetical protein
MLNVTEDSLALLRKVDDNIQTQNWDEAFDLVNRFGALLHHGWAIITVDGTEESSITGNELQCLSMARNGIAFADEDEEALSDAKCFIRRIIERLDGTVASWTVLSYV